MIKLIAALTMLIDHIGLMFFPGNAVFRIVGRLSFPLFAYCLARGYESSRQRRTIPRYLYRLAVFSLVSQIPFMLSMGGGTEWNIGFTLMAALLLLTFTGNVIRGTGGVLEIAIAAVLTVAAGIYLPFEYSLYGLLLPTVLYFAVINRKDYYLAAVTMTALWGVYTLSEGGKMFLQVFAVLAVPLIAFIERHELDNKVHLPPGFYYAFYPAHLLLLAAVKYFMVKGA